MGAASQSDAEAFKKHFPAIEPLIREEWPEVDPKALEQTDGDQEKVVDLISKKTEHTKTLVKRQIAELLELAVEDHSEELISKAERRLKEVRAVIASLQAKAAEMATYMRRDMLPDAKAKANEHPLVTLLMAVGLGFILGFILRGFGRGR